MAPPIHGAGGGAPPWRSRQTGRERDRRPGRPRQVSYALFDGGLVGEVPTCTADDVKVAVERAGDTCYRLNASLDHPAHGEQLAVRVRAGTVDVNEGYAAVAVQQLMRVGPRKSRSNAAHAGIRDRRGDSCGAGVGVDDPYLGGVGPRRRGCVAAGECMTGCRHVRRTRSRTWASTRR